MHDEDEFDNTNPSAEDIELSKRAEALGASFSYHRDSWYWGLQSEPFMAEGPCETLGDAAREFFEANEPELEDGSEPTPEMALS